MADKREYRLKIEAYSPETMPMKRLVEYLSDLSILFGEEAHVHLVGIESSSTCPVFLIDSEAEPRVLDRVKRAREKTGPEEAVRAIENINFRLSRDGTCADIVNSGQDSIIGFPGVKNTKPVEWPSIDQPGELYGVPIAIGGKGDMVPVHLLDGDTEYHLLADRGKAKLIASHLFTSTIRVIGRGRWRKLPNGVWNLDRFIIEEFELVKIATLSEAVKGLRSIDAKWKQLDDPLAVLEEIRTGVPIERA